MRLVSLCAAVLGHEQYDYSTTVSMHFSPVICVEAYVLTRECGGAGCHGFWETGQNTIFDMRITDIRIRSYRNKDLTKSLAAQEKEEKDKHLASLHTQRKDFTTMVYTVDGIAGREAQIVEKCLALFLVEKWRQECSNMIFT